MNCVQKGKKDFILLNYLLSKNRNIDGHFNKNVMRKAYPYSLDKTKIKLKSFLDIFSSIKAVQISKQKITQ